MLWLMALVAVGLVGFSQGRRYEQSQLHAEWDAVTQKRFENWRIESVLSEIAREHAKALATEHPDLADDYRCFYSRDE
jgi:hypothetical protein